MSFALIWLIGLLFATGITGPFKNIFQFLFDHVFILRGMRDTHKFVTLIVLSYSILGAFGLKEIIKSIKSNKIKKIDENQIVEEIEKKANEMLSPSIVNVINATGITIHTNLGRSLIDEEIFEYAKKKSYALLQSRI